MTWKPIVDRFCYQYLQLDPNPELPSRELARLSAVQDAIYQKLFAPGAVRYGPPTSYQLLILKRLVAHIEASIDDWDAHVSCRAPPSRLPLRRMCSDRLLLCDP